MANLALSACVAEIKTNPGKFYVYAMFRSCGTPFYVGKGRKRRITRHEELAKSGVRGHRYAIIRKIWSVGGSVRYSLSFYDTDTLAIAEERRLICQFGREAVGGPLVNLTDGGDGMSGYSPAASTRAKLAAVSKVAWTNKEKVKERLVAQRAAQAAPEFREQSRLRANKLWGDPEFRAKVSAGHVARGLSGPRTRSVDDGTRIAAGDRMRKFWSDPSFKEKHSVAVKSEDYRKRVSDSIKALWKDPEYRARMMAARNK